MESQGVSRRDAVKKGVDREAGRRNRFQNSISIRKEKKNQALNQRRKLDSNNDENEGFGMTPQVAVSISQLPEMVQALYSESLQDVHDAVMKFRKILSVEKKPPIQRVIDAGVVPRLVQLISQDENTSIQFEAAWALTNIASGTSAHTQTVIEAGAVPIFAKLLASPNEDVREQAIWALGNIAGDSSKCRNLVLNSGALPLLLNQLSSSSKISLLRNATWTLSNFCRGKPPPDFNLVKGVLPTLAYLVKTSTDNDILADACWALSYLSDGKNEKIEAVIQTGVCPKIVELLIHPHFAVQTPALRTIGNIATGDDNQTQIVIHCGALGPLLHLLQSERLSIVKETCWTISNITAGLPAQIQAVFEAGFIPPLIDILKNAEFEVRKEAAWAISNSTSGGTPEQIKFIVQQGCIPPLCDQLNAKDTKIIKVALEGLENILRIGEQEKQLRGLEDNPFAMLIEECGGLDSIEKLQETAPDDICDKVVRILETYFDGEDATEVIPGPGQTANGMFAFQGDMPNAGQEQQQMPGLFGQATSFSQNGPQQGQNPSSGGFNFGDLQ